MLYQERSFKGASTSKTVKLIYLHLYFVVNHNNPVSFYLYICFQIFTMQHRAIIHYFHLLDVFIEMYSFLLLAAVALADLLGKIPSVHTRNEFWYLLSIPKLWISPVCFQQCVHIHGLYYSQGTLYPTFWRNSKPFFSASVIVIKKKKKKGGVKSDYNILMTGT